MQFIRITPKKIISKTQTRFRYVVPFARGAHRQSGESGQSRTFRAIVAVRGIRRVVPWSMIAARLR